jgi:hypothetical protein
VTGKGAAKVWFVWRESRLKFEETGDSSADIESAYLFEKLTGIPRRYFPIREDAKPPRRFEDFGTVNAEGSEAITRRFAPDK